MLRPTLWAFCRGSARACCWTRLNWATWQRVSWPLVPFFLTASAAPLPAFCAVLHRTVPDESGAKAVDGVLVAQPGADPAVFWLRYHSLPLDGRGHHLQARPGAYGGHRGGGGGVLLAGRIERRHFPYHDQRPPGCREIGRAHV